jgi:hypothetical protein
MLLCHFPIAAGCAIIADEAGSVAASTAGLMSGINLLPPITDMLAGLLPPIMPLRHGGQRDYHKAKYMPGGRNSFAGAP